MILMQVLTRYEQKHQETISDRNDTLLMQKHTVCEQECTEDDQ